MIQKQLKDALEHNKYNEIYNDNINYLYVETLYFIIVVDKDEIIKIQKEKVKIHNAKYKDKDKI